MSEDKLMYQMAECLDLHYVNPECQEIIKKIIYLASLLLDMMRQDAKRLEADVS